MKKYMEHSYLVNNLFHLHHYYIDLEVIWFMYKIYLIFFVYLFYAWCVCVYIYSNLIIEVNHVQLLCNKFNLNPILNQ